MMPDGKTLKALCDAHMIEIEPEDLQTADVVLVRWQKGPPQHLGITVDYPGGRLAMVHAASVGRAGVVETRLEFGRAMGLVACYAVPGVG